MPPQYNGMTRGCFAAGKRHLTHGSSYQGQDKLHWPASEKRKPHGCKTISRTAARNKANQRKRLANLPDTEEEEDEQTQQQGVSPSSQSDQSGQSDQSDQSGQSDQSDQSDHSDQSDQSDQSDHIDQSARAGNMGSFVGTVRGGDGAEEYDDSQGPPSLLAPLLHFAPSHTHHHLPGRQKQFPLLRGMSMELPLRPAAGATSPTKQRRDRLRRWQGRDKRQQEAEPYAHSRHGARSPDQTRPVTMSYESFRSTRRTPTPPQDSADIRRPTLLSYPAPNWRRCLPPWETPTLTQLSF